MAIYKVPQDVEAEDKLIGPFTFRQFIYLGIVAAAIVIAWFLAGLFLPLLIIPLPIILFFGALALPLRRDQPMEIYMAALAMYFLKPRRRLWVPDGIESLIEITVPKIAEIVRIKDISQTEAQRKFSYLAEIVDSQGWAVRSPGTQSPNSAMNSDAYFAAQQVSDILDDNTTIARSLDDKLTQSDAKKRQELAGFVANQIKPPAPDLTKIPVPVFNPYPTEIKQAVVEPISEQSHHQPQTVQQPTEGSKNPTPTAIINLANNNELSIATIAHEANRIKSISEGEEVVISLH